MMYPLVEDLAAEGVSVVSSCRVLGFNPQAFYKWRSQPFSDREWDNAHLVNAMVDIHADDPEFGYRFIADELRHAGHSVGVKRPGNGDCSRGARCAGPPLSHDSLHGLEPL